ncbi:MAG: MFS transporter [Candidatus Helarchaeota archaeon]
MTVTQKNQLEVEEWNRYFTYLTIFLSVFTFFFLFAIMYRLFTINELAILLSVNVKDMPLIFGFISLGSLFIMFTRRIADLPQFGRKKATILYGTLSLSLYLLSYFLSDLILFIITRLIAGMFAINLSSLIISEEVPAKYRGRVVGIVQGVGMTSSLLAAYLSTLFNILPPQGWQLMFCIFIVPGIILIVILGSRMKETRRFKSLQHENSSSLFGIFKKKYLKHLILCSLMLLFMGLIFITIKSYFKPYLIEIGYSLFDIGYLAMLSYIGSIIGYYASGFLSDKIGRKMTIYISVMIYFVGTVFFLFFTHFYIVLIGFFIINFTFSIFFVTSDLLSSELFQTAQRSTAIGWISFFASIGSIVGNFIITFLNYLIGWRGVFILIGTIAIILLIITISFIPETKGRVLEEIIATEIEGVI